MSCRQYVVPAQAGTQFLARGRSEPRLNLGPGLRRGDR